ELARPRDKPLSGTRLLVVLGLQATQRSRVELGDDVAHLEARFLGRAPRRHPLDLGPDLIALRTRIGPYDDPDPTVIVAEREGERARGPRRPRRPWRAGRRRGLLRREPGRPQGRDGGDDQPLTLHV